MVVGQVCKAFRSFTIVAVLLGYEMSGRGIIAKKFLISLLHKLADSRSEMRRKCLDRCDVLRTEADEIGQELVSKLCVFFESFFVDRLHELRSSVREGYGDKEERRRLKPLQTPPPR